MQYSHAAARVMLVLALIGAAWFLRGFLAVGAVAALTVLLFNPLYHRLLHLLRGHTATAAGLTMLVALVTAVVPLTLIGLLCYYQTIIFLSDLHGSDLARPGHWQQLLTGAIDTFNALMARLPDGAQRQLSAEEAIGAVQSLIPAASNFTLNFLRQTGSSLLGFGTGLVLYLIVLFSLFRHQEAVLAWLRRISPFTNTINNRYLAHIASVGRSMALGTFVVAAVQGILSAFFLSLAGVPYPVFWAVFLSLVSILPLGSGIITVPIGIIQILLGNVWQGLFILATFLVIITNIDNLLRAMLVGKDAHLPPVLTLLSLFAGISIFGPLGAVYGPIIMVVLMTTFQIYDQFSDKGIPLKADAGSTSE